MYDSVKALQIATAGLVATRVTIKCAKVLIRIASKGQQVALPPSELNASPIAVW